MFLVWTKGEQCFKFGPKESNVSSLDQRKAMFLVWTKGKQCFKFGLRKAMFQVWTKGKHY